MKLLDVRDNASERNFLFPYYKNDTVSKMRKDLEIGLCTKIKLKKWTSLEELNFINGNTKVRNLL